jgi:hypothetical protein
MVVYRVDEGGGGWQLPKRKGEDGGGWGGGGGTCTPVARARVVSCGIKYTQSSFITP